MKFAESRGVNITINGGHAKLSKHGVTTIISSPGKKKDFDNSARKATIDAFKAMGIAWD